jgi:hypothetical protein
MEDTMYFIVRRYGGGGENQIDSYLADTTYMSSKPIWSKRIGDAKKYDSMPAFVPARSRVYVVTNGIAYGVSLKNTILTTD